MFSWGWAVLASTETVAKNVTIVTPSDKTGRYILIAAIVTVVGSIAVAFIAATTAGKRQKRSLGAADDEHKDTLKSQAEQHEETLKSQAKQHTESLDAEDRRLRQRLQHERRQQDVQNLRIFFDEIVMDYVRAGRALAWFSALRKPALSAPKTISEAQTAAFEARNQVAVALDRAALWFGEEHEVYRSYKQIDDTVNKRFDFLIATQGELTPEQSHESATLGGQLLTAFRRFTVMLSTQICGERPRCSRDATS